MRHALDSTDDGHVLHAAGHGEVAEARRCRARGTGGFDADRLDAGKARIVGDEAAHLLLVIEHRARHVADVEHVDGIVVDPGVIERLANGSRRQVAA